MTTEWTDLPTLQDVAAAQARGDEIEYINPRGIVWSPWYGTLWDRTSKYRSRPKQKTPEERIAELEKQRVDVLEAIKYIALCTSSAETELRLTDLIEKIEAMK